MKIVIVGAGVVGTHVAQQLTVENKDVVLIEKNPEIARIVTNILDCMIINDDGSHLDVLHKAGVADCDYFIALTGTDEVNMVSCGMVSGEFKKPKTIARVRNPYYSSLSTSKRSFMGIDYIINPEIEAANTIIRAIEEGVVSDLFTLQQDKLQLRTYAVGADSPFLEKTLVTLRQELGMDFLVAALVREGSLIIPSGDVQVKNKDIMYFLGSPQTLNTILGSLSLIKSELKKIAIVGGNRITEYIIKALQSNNAEKGKSIKNFFSSFIKFGNRQITVIENSKDKAKYFSQIFPNITVLNRDVAEEGTLEQEQFSSFDLVLTVTEHQSLNLLTAMAVKQMGVKKSLALVLNNNYVKFAGKLDVDVVVSLKSAVVNSILYIIRRANMKTLHSFYEDDLELVELTIKNNSKPVGKKIQDINIPKGALIIFVLRNGENIIPTGSTVLLSEDQIGIIAKKESISKLESVFEGDHEL
jgi:trk system potassium uptake protein TrkA